VKYTTARAVAERTVNVACDRLEHTGSWPDSSVVPVDGGDLQHLAEHEAGLRQNLPTKLQPVIGRLARNYGTRAIELIRDCLLEPDEAEPITLDSEAIRAEVRYAVREEMAVRLADVVLRRTDLGTAAFPGRDALKACAAIMADELGWSERQTAEEVLELANRAGAWPCAELEAGCPADNGSPDDEGPLLDNAAGSMS
jgi:glycerol-3-phosphate dehydrogenase